MSRAAEGPGRIAAPCVRLDDFLGEGAVALIKIDVEGFELAALRGADETLRRDRPVLYVENEYVDKSKALIEWLWSRGYRLFWHLPPLFSPDNFFGKSANAYGRMASFNIIGMPTELLQGNLPGLNEIVDSSEHPLSKNVRREEARQCDEAAARDEPARGGEEGAPTPPPAPELKLNLGCGNRKMDGFVNVDRVAACRPDKLVDLEQTPWPWEDSSVAEIKLIHVLEHLGQRAEVFLAIVKEMYRVCRDGARIEIIVPHPRHDSFLGDPTHVRLVTDQTLSLFDQRYNRETVEEGKANTPLGLILGVDFEIESFVLALASPWHEKLSSGQIGKEELVQAASRYNNVIEQSTFVWRVRKPGREAVHGPGQGT
jgi:hypothetical protein